MSMFGAVDLSTLAPSKGAASGAGSEAGAAPGVADSGVIDSPFVKLLPAPAWSALQRPQN